MLLVLTIALRMSTGSCSWCTAHLVLRTLPLVTLGFVRMTRYLNLISNEIWILLNFAFSLSRWCSGATLCINIDWNALIRSSWCSWTWLIQTAFILVSTLGKLGLLLVLLSWVTSGLTLVLRTVLLFYLLLQNNLLFF